MKVRKPDSEVVIRRRGGNHFEAHFQPQGRSFHPDSYSCLLCEHSAMIEDKYIGLGLAISSSLAIGKWRRGFNAL